jgi:hypothetical protein
MKDIYLKPTLSGKGEKKQNSRGKSFGYQILGFGSGVSGAGPVAVDYLVIAGGGGGGNDDGGGGGAGGYKESNGTSTGSYTVSPLGSGTFEVEPGAYDITVGGGGNGAVHSPATQATNGSNSVFSTITSTGGGFGGRTPQAAGNPGGSGGGGASTQPAGSASPPGQGQPGGAASPGPNFAGGGGGATQAGSAGSGSAPSPGVGGPGGDGATSNITNTPTTRAGGGGGGAFGGPSPKGTGGAGGGGNAGSTPNGTGIPGTANTGGGGGGGSTTPGNRDGGNGGSGIVVVRVPATTTLAVAPGTNSVATLPAPAGSYKVATFTVSGTLTVN